MGKLGAESFGRRLKQARLQFGTNRLATLGQEELGRLLGVTGVTIGRWEDGSREPGSLALLERLAGVLGVSPCFLAFGGERAGGIHYEPPEIGNEPAAAMLERKGATKKRRKIR